jgi:hypothetical protein
MANAFVDQMKGLALRHGEKAGVALASMVFFLCVVKAAMMPSIDTSPDQIKKAAEQSDSNLNRKEEREAIVKRLEEVDKITDTKFAATVEEQTKVQLAASDFKPAREWITPEPGAGLIRDQPKLIAPTELYAYPGRGGLLVYALDEKGERIPLKEGEEKEERPQRYGNTRKPRAGGGGMMGGMMGGMGGARKKRGKSQVEIDREAKEEREKAARKLKAQLAGKVGPETDAEKKKEEEAAPEPAYKEVTKGYRWVAITGVLDHGQLVANYREALKNPAVAHPHYERLDLERKTLQPDGTWSAWQAVDAAKNLDILDNIPEYDDELAPENVRPGGLVDPLPFLKAGVWEKVHIASLVPKEKRELPPETPVGGMGPMGAGMPGMMMGRMGGGGMGNQEGAGGMMGGMMGRSMMMGGMMGGAGMGGKMGEMGGMGMMGGMMGGGETVGDFWKSDEKRVMIRALDFTAEEDRTYRYRVRIVVFNPNLNRDDVNPGVNKTDKELKGPWSQETDPVHMPPDVEPYVLGTLDPNPKSDRKVRFQVVRFNLGDGWTIPNNFEASPGEVIGDLRTRGVPASDGSGSKSKPIDFHSHQIVLGVFMPGQSPATPDPGGYQQLPSAMVGTPVERPAMAVLLRPDGSIVVHNQADDLSNQFRVDIELNYRHEIANSTKKRENSYGMGMMGMMGGYGGMMGGMMGGSR